MLSSFGFLSALLVLASVVVVLSIAFGIRMFLFPERSARDRIVDLTGGAREEEPGHGVRPASAQARRRAPGVAQDIGGRWWA